MPGLTGPGFFGTMSGCLFRPARPRSPRPNPAEALMAQKLVLIVEDEPDNREIIRTVVEDLMGHAAALAADGEAALTAIARRRPDLILMDLMMPVLNGFDTIQA